LTFFVFFSVSFGILISWWHRLWAGLSEVGPEIGTLEKIRRDTRSIMLNTGSTLPENTP